MSRDPAVRHSYRVLAVAPEQTWRWEKVRRRVTDLAAPPTAVAREVGDPDLAVWQATLLDLREREPVTAMAVLRAGVTDARRGPTRAKAAGRDGRVWPWVPPRHASLGLPLHSGRVGARVPSSR